MMRDLLSVDQPTKNVVREDAPQFLSRNASSEQRTKHYIETRWHEQYTYYTFKAERNRRRHMQLQMFIAVVAVLVPVLLGFNANLINAVRAAVDNNLLPVLISQNNIGFWISFVNAVPAILSGLVAGATALENVQKYGDNFRAFQSASDGLERERALFESNAGPYRKSSTPYRLFVERSEDVIAQETGRYFAREQQAGEDDPDEEPEDIFEELMGIDDDGSGEYLPDDTSATTYP